MTMFGTFSTFLLWEKTTHDTIDFKKAYVDMAGGDVLAGLLLSQLVYWYLPTDEGKSRLRVFHDNYYWVAKTRKDWYKEVRLSPKQVDRVRKVLEKLNLIVAKVYKFNGSPTLHFRIKPHEFIDAWNNVVSQEGRSFLPFREEPDQPTGEMVVDETDNSLTETTSETTTKWSKCLAELEMQMTREVFSRLLRGSELLDVTPARALIRVHDASAVEWCTARLAKSIRRTLSGVLGDGWAGDVEFVAENEEAE